jgi:hypothetical protein
MAYGEIQKMRKNVIYLRDWTWFRLAEAYSCVWEKMENSNDNKRQV